MRALLVGLAALFMACNNPPASSAASDGGSGSTGTGGPPAARPILHLLTSGNGLIRGAGSDCHGACDVPFDAGTHVTLTAVPDGGWSFGGWTGACSGSGACELTLGSDATLTATFTQSPPPPPPPPPSQHTLSVAVTGSGSVSSSPAGIQCGRDCSHAFDDGTAVTLTPSPGSGSYFAGWGGACSGSGACTVKMSADQAVSATFTAVATLTLAFSGNGHGTVTVGGHSCSATCDIVFDRGATLTLHADAPGDARFMGWTDACNGAGDCVLKLDGDKKAGVIFWPYPAYTVQRFGDFSTRAGGIDAQGNIVFVTASPNGVGDLAYYRDAQTGGLRQLWPTTDAWDTKISPGGRIALTTFHWNGQDDAWNSYRLEGSAWVPVRTLGGVDGSYVSWIDDGGVVLGGSHVSGTGDSRIFHAYRDDGTAIYDLGTTERNSMAAGAGGGLIVGSNWQSPYDPRHAVVWDNGSIRRLDAFASGYPTTAVSINAHGASAGWAEDTNHATWGILWDRSGAMTNVGALPGAGGSVLESINDDGVAVGASNSKAALWFNHMLWDLNALAGTQSLQHAVLINAQGRIVASGFDGNGWGEFVLVPR